MPQRRSIATRTSVAAAAVLAMVALTVIVVLVDPRPAKRSATPVVATPSPTLCANSTSDAAKLQAAINATAVGAEIVFHGPCLINTPLILLGGRSYRGDSRQTTLTEAPGSNLPAVLVSDSWANNSPTTGVPIELSNLTIDANSAANPSGGDGLIIRSWQTTVQDVTIANAKKDGLLLTNVSENGTTLTNTQVNGTLRNLFIDSSGQDGIHVQDSGNSITDWNLLDSWIASSGQDGISTDNASGWTISGNHIYGVGGAAMSVNRLFATNLNANYIEDFQTSGIIATVQGDAASVISDNRIFNFSGKGSTFLDIVDVNYGTGHLSVTGNVIRGRGAGVGLAYAQGKNHLEVTSTGNEVSDVATSREVGKGVALTAGY